MSAHRTMVVLAGTWLAALLWLFGPSAWSEDRSPLINSAQAAAGIDRLVDAALVRQGTRPAPDAGDAAFLRRACLDLIGRNPTAAEYAAYVATPAATRRTALVDQLLASPARVHRDAIWWFDLLRAETRLMDRYPGQNYLDWIKAQVRANVPYDRMVRALITAQGPAMAPDNGATGFYLRDAGMPLDHAAVTSQVFLGTAIGCAQCHDHPFDIWTRKQFYQFAACTADVQTKRDFSKSEQREFQRAVKDSPPEARNAMRQLADVLRLTVQPPHTDQLKLPSDYQYHDAKPGTPVQATPLFGGPLPTRDNAAAAFADWLTAPDNPRFTAVAANRLWKRLFGRGLVEPVDRWTDTTVPTDPALMAELERLLKAVDYDTVRFLGIVARTRAYGRATVAPADAPDDHVPAGPVRRRLTAEQAWDSLVALLDDRCDDRRGVDASAQTAFYTEHHDESVDRLADLAKHIGEARSALLALRPQLKETRDALQDARKAKDQARARTLQARLEELDAKRDELESSTDRLRLVRAGGKNQRAAKGLGPLLRADELPQPAPPGHFLRIFGQSDRQLPDNARATPTVPQALLLMNGVVDQAFSDRHSPLGQALAEADRADDRVAVLYRLILGREPDAAERRRCRDAAVDGTAGLTDLAWVLLNSSEFIFLP